MLFTGHYVEPSGYKMRVAVCASTQAEAEAKVAQAYRADQERKNARVWALIWW